MDAEDDSLAAALSNCVTRDGQSPATANLPMGGFRHTGVANGTTRNSYSAIGQVQDGAILFGGTTGGAADAYTASVSPPITALVAGMRFGVIIHATNTGASQINFNSTGLTDITKNGTTALDAGDLPLNAMVLLGYDGTRFQLLSIEGPSAARLDTAQTFTATQTFGAPVIFSRGAALDDTDIDGSNILTVGSDGNSFDLGGTQQIDGIATVGVGTVLRFHCTSARTLTHNATDFDLLGGADITTAAGDVFEVEEYATADWRMISYERASGTALLPTTGWLHTDTSATTSGTTVDLTGIPSTVNRIRLGLSGVATDTNNQTLLIQLGDSGGFETTGYSGALVQPSPTVELVTNSAGFALTDTVNFDASEIFVGEVELTHYGSNVWSANVRGNQQSGQTLIWAGNGFKTLSGTLTQIRLTTAGGTAVFDAGTLYLAAN